MDHISEILMSLAFFMGVFKSTPEGRARRVLAAKHKAERKLMNAQERWRKNRLKYAREIRKEWSSGDITREDYDNLLTDYDRDYPRPK